MCKTKKEVHEVEEEVVESKTEVEDNCRDETSGYTTKSKCVKLYLKRLPRDTTL